MMKLASLVMVAVALAGCAVDGSDPDPADQQDQSKTGEQQQPKQDDTTTTNQAPPPVVDTGTTPMLKTRHDTM